MRLILEGDAHPPVIICHAAEFMPAPRARVGPDLRLAESSVALKPGDAILPAGSRPLTAGRCGSALTWKRASPEVSWPALRPAAETGGRSAAGPARSAWRLADAASFLLPTAHRDRYSMEFRSELWIWPGLALATCRSCGMPSASSVSVLPMRLALRSPRRKSNVADRNAGGTRHTQIRRFTSSCQRTANSSRRSRMRSISGESRVPGVTSENQVGGVWR